LKKISVRFDGPLATTLEWPRGTLFAFRYFTDNEPCKVDVLCSRYVFLRERRPTSDENAAAVSRDYARQHIEKRLKGGQLDAYEKVELDQAKYEELEKNPLGHWESFEVQID
jgi:hypothetical protein